MPRNSAMDSPPGLLDTSKGDTGFLSIDDIDSDGEDTDNEEYVDGDDSDDEEEEGSEDDSDELEPENPNIFERSNEHTHLQAVLDPPFWYGNEDADQTAPIFATYAERLQVPLRNNTRIREPKLFVGCIKRQAVSNCGSTNWTTLDEVSVFTREKVAFGMSMPVTFTRMLLTVWDSDEGLPSTQYSLKTTANRRYWLARVQGSPSFLYALPDAQDVRDQGFKYHVSDDDEAVGYAPLSSRITFAPWVPMVWLRSDLDAEEGSLFGDEDVPTTAPSVMR